MRSGVRFNMLNKTVVFAQPDFTLASAAWGCNFANATVNSTVFYNAGTNTCGANSSGAVKVQSSIQSAFTSASFAENCKRC